MIYKKRNILCLIIVTVLAFSIWGAILFAMYEGMFTSVRSGHFKIEQYNGFLRTPDGYVFDTGSNGSINFTDSLPSVALAGFSFTFDGDDNLKVTSISLLPNLSLSNSVSIVNLLTANHKDNILHKQKGTRVIIGTNAMRKANWLFSFKQNLAEVFPLDKRPLIPKDALCFPFSSNRTPNVQLEIMGKKFDFLIDTGFNGDVAINDETFFETLNGQRFKTDTINSFTLFGNMSALSYAFDELNIDGKEYKHVKVRILHKNLIGLAFIRRYANMFWDSKNRKMWLWDDCS